FCHLVFHLIEAWRLFLPKIFIKIIIATPAVKVYVNTNMNVRLLGYLIIIYALFIMWRLCHHISLEIGKTLLVQKCITQDMILNMGSFDNKYILLFLWIPHRNSSANRIH
ncbi:hypothetical protein L9F63_002607, partial [Diploptera punctata]